MYSCQIPWGPLGLYSSTFARSYRPATWSPRAHHGVLCRKLTVLTQSLAPYQKTSVKLADWGHDWRVEAFGADVVIACVEGGVAHSSYPALVNKQSKGPRLASSNTKRHRMIDTPF